MIGMALSFMLLSGVAQAITFSGYLNDPGNTALVGPDPAPTNPPSFTDDFAIANNTALYAWTAAAAGTYKFKSLGYAAGGVDPYFTLFTGTGSGATFLDSSFFQPAGDFEMDIALAAGTYTIAMGAFFNMSFAENFGGALTLGDGFIGLGQPDSLGNYYYELNVENTDEPPAPTPEPVTFVLLLTGLAGFAALRRRVQQ
jgi:hypothetical protein